MKLTTIFLFLVILGLCFAQEDSKPKYDTEQMIIYWIVLPLGLFAILSCCMTIVLIFCIYRMRYKKTQEEVPQCCYNDGAYYTNQYTEDVDKVNRVFSR